MYKDKYPDLLAEMIKHDEHKEDLGKVLGISYGAIQRRFNGKTKFSVDEANKICEHYGKSYEELFRRKD